MQLMWEMLLHIKKPHLVCPPMTDDSGEITMINKLSPGVPAHVTNSR